MALPSEIKRSMLIDYREATAKQAAFDKEAGARFDRVHNELKRKFPTALPRDVFVAAVDHVTKETSQ